MQALGLPVQPTVADACFVNGCFDVQPSELQSLPIGGSLRCPQGRLVAVRCSSERLSAISASGGHGSQTRGEPGWSRPWHLLDPVVFAQALARDIQLIVQSWTAVEHGTVPSWAAVTGSAGVHVHASARVGANAVLDATDGPILLDHNSEVRHGAILIGPVYVGRHSIVAERAHIKARTSIGPHSRMGGEVGSVIVQGYSNKVHDGHLGDALLGEWVNLGAGTVNSNLLNTYGEVAMHLRPSGPRERTGRQFMGCIIGDHTKVAIGTRIMTGSSIGLGVMWAASAPITGAIGSFSWVTDDGQRLYQPEKFLQLARTVMARRKVEFSQAESDLLSHLLASTPPRGGDRA
jgi:UDP-N-acetylglucosamine diphosphorylase/glucosamine-1-phosphate N-acetyltransferase